MKKIVTSKTIDGYAVEKIGQMKDLQFYATTKDIVYIVRDEEVLGTLTCGTSQGFGYIDEIEECK